MVPSNLVVLRTHAFIRYLYFPEHLRILILLGFVSSVSLASLGFSVSQGFLVFLGLQGI